MSSTNAKINYKYAAIENTVIANLDPTRPHQSSDSSQGSPARCDDGLVFEPNTRSGMVLYPKAVCRTSLTPCFPRVRFFLERDGRGRRGPVQSMRQERQAGSCVLKVGTSGGPAPLVPASHFLGPALGIRHDSADLVLPASPHASPSCAGPFKPLLPKPCRSGFVCDSACVLVSHKSCRSARLRTSLIFRSPQSRQLPIATLRVAVTGKSR